MPRGHCAVEIIMSTGLFIVGSYLRRGVTVQFIMSAGILIAGSYLRLQRDAAHLQLFTPPKRRCPFLGGEGKTSSAQTLWRSSSRNVDGKRDQAVHAPKTATGSMKGRTKNTPIDETCPLVTCRGGVVSARIRHRKANGGTGRGTWRTDGARRSRF